MGADIESIVAIDFNGRNHAFVAEVGIEKEKALKILAKSKEYKIKPEDVSLIIIDGINYWGGPTTDDYSK